MNLWEIQQHFIKNQKHFEDLNWKDVSITQKEKNIISSSMQQFQRWESSEGKHLIQYALDNWNAEYIDTVKYFIREEQVHAQVLGKFMQENNIPLIKHHWIDNTFRFLRKMSSLENSVMVLVTAEIIAAVYYQSLWNATKSKTLKNICEQILRDEAVHIEFQSITLWDSYIKKWVIWKAVSRIYHTMLMISTIIIVWIYHKKVFLSTGYTFKIYYSAVMQEFQRARDIVYKK